MIQFNCTGLWWSMRLENTHWDWSPTNHFLFQLFLWQVAFVVWLCIHLLLWAGQVYLCNRSCTVDRCKLRTNLTIVLNSESLNYFPAQLCLLQNITTTQVWGSFTRTTWRLKEFCLKQKAGSSWGRFCASESQSQIELSAKMRREHQPSKGGNPTSISFHCSSCGI